MRSSICSSDAMGVAGPPQYFRRSPWMAPCGLPVRWWCAATRALSSRRRSLSRSATPASRRNSRTGDGDGSGAAAAARGRLLAVAVELLALAAAQERPHLVGLEEPGQPEVVLLLGRARARRGAEGRPVVDQLVELGLGGQRLERLLLLARLVLGAVGRLEEVVLPALLRPVGLAEDVVALHLELAGQREQRRHARAGRRSRSPPAAATGRSGRRPARRTAASRRWWRRRRRPAAGRRRPRTPCGRRPASARSCARTPRCARRPSGRPRARRRAPRPRCGAAARRRPWPWCGRWR